MLEHHNVGSAQTCAASAAVPWGAYAHCSGETEVSAAHLGDGRRPSGVYRWEYDDAARVFVDFDDRVPLLLGLDPDRLAGEPGVWESIIHPADRPWATTFSSTAITRGHDHEFEYRIVRPDGEVVWLRESTTPILREDGAYRGRRSIVTDITEHKRLEFETRQAAAEFETVFGLLKGLYFRVDREGVIRRSSASMAGVLREPLITVDGARLSAVVPETLAHAIEAGIGAVAGGERSFATEVVAEGGDGGRLLELSVFPLEEEYAVVVRDVSERLETRRAEERHRQQLASLALQVERAAEHERRRIAEEIHDRVSQTLAIARLRLLTGKGRLGQTDIGHVIELIDMAIAESRALTTELTPAGLYDLGLGIALDKLCQTLSAQYGVRYRLEDRVDSWRGLDDDVAGFMYRAVRELLVNVAKHAQTSDAVCILERDDRVVRATVADRGIGGVPDPKRLRPDETGGYGLFSIRERAQALGGRLTVNSRPGTGTQVTVEVPLAAAERDGRVTP